MNILCELNELNNNLLKHESDLNSVSVKTSENVLNICNNKCVKMCRISTECKDLSENEISE